MNDLGQVLLDWLPWILVAIVPGLFNLVAAYQELNELCKYLPFFEPWRNLGVWIWAVIQVLFPAALFWLLANLMARPSIDLILLVKGALFGLGFIALLNASTQIGDRTYQLKPLYTFFVNIAKSLIAQDQTGRSAAFWTDVETELTQPSANLEQGLNFLENYFVRSDITLSEIARESYRSKLAQVRFLATRAEQAEAIVSLLDVRRQDLPKVLRRFDLQESFFKQYFPHRPHRLVIKR